MATQRGMSGIDLMAVSSELSVKLPLWIGKIYQYGPGTFGVRLNGEDKAKYYLLIEEDRRLHLTDTLPPAPGNPSGYSMFLRKYIRGGRILEIRQHGVQRILDITVGKSETQYHMIVELFNDGNILLCDAEYTIIQPLHRRKYRERMLTTGVIYEFPGEDVTQVSEDHLREILQTSDQDLVRTLATHLMLGGKFAEEVCARAGFEKNSPAGEAEASQLTTAFTELLDEIRNKPYPVITAKGCWPILLQGEEEKESFATFNVALDAFFPKAAEKKPEKEKGRKLSKEENIRHRQREAIKGFEKKISRNEVLAACLYAHYSTIDALITTLRAASSDHSWQEIELALKKSDLPAAQIITRIYPDESAVDVLLDENRIKIYVHESVEVNAGNYYDQVKKFRRKKEGAIRALGERLAQDKKQAKKEKVWNFEKPKWYHKFRWFVTSDGTLALGGKSAGENEELVKKYFEGNDTFLHATVHGGSVVLVKGPTTCWDEVGAFAASYSNAWKSGYSSVDVDGASRSQVSKTPESGEFVAKGSFVIRGERQHFKNMSVGIAIGIRTEPTVAIIGGPIHPIIDQTVHSVILRPGIYEPNDVAKKILREFKGKISAEEEKAWKRVLTGEQVAKFVPPGGSEIAEIR